MKALITSLVFFALCIPAYGYVPGVRCPIFPKNNHWNQRVDHLPTHINSDRYMQTIGLSETAHADFGSGHWEGAPIGIPYSIVKRTTKRKKVIFEYADESDRVGYPIPRKPRIEGGPNSTGDRHILMIDKSRCKLYELFAAYPGRPWTAGSGAVFNLRSNRLRPDGWTSADAAGLPIFPGLARYEEVRKGIVRHALRFTVARTQRAYLYPARHFASSITDDDYPPMGVRLRLRADFPVADYPRQTRVILKALQQYGMILADNGSDLFISGSPHPGWNNDDLRSMHQLSGHDFEAVDTNLLPRP